MNTIEYSNMYSIVVLTVAQASICNNTYLLITSVFTFCLVRTDIIRIIGTLTQYRTSSIITGILVMGHRICTLRSRFFFLG